MKTTQRWTLLALSAVCLSGTTLARPAAQAGGTGASGVSDSPVEGVQRFVRAGAEGVDLRNVADREGITLVHREPASVMAVFRERAGWLEVEVPGGLPVWVYGRFLRKTDDESIYEVTGDGINLRPRPSRDVSNFPLSGRLHTGDRVRAIQRNDGSLPLSEDWVRIWSPPGIHAWVHSDETVPLGAGEDGATLWRDALGKLAEGRAPLPPVARETPASAPAPSTAKAAPAATPTPAAAEAEERALQALEEAGTLLATERRAERPNFVPVRAAYDRVVELAPGSMAAQLARQGIETVEALEAAASLKNELAQERDRREGELRDRQEEIWETTRRKDPLYGRFDGRGVLERRSSGGAAARYFLRRGGEDAFEVTCVSRRYDLALFAGYEIGILGATEDGSPRLDVDRLFVLSRR